MGGALGGIFVGLLMNSRAEGELVALFREEWRRALASGRMLLISPFPASVRRATLQLSDYRNRIAAALAERILLIHATPGGRLSRQMSELSGRGISLYCPDHPANTDLRLLGALPFPLRSEEWSFRSTGPVRTR